MANFPPKLLVCELHLQKAGSTAGRRKCRRAPCAGPAEETVWIPSKFHEQTHNAMKEAPMLKQTL